MASQMENSWARKMTAIDREKKTKFFLDSLSVELVSRVKRPATKPRVVVLTGSTGFLSKGYFTPTDGRAQTLRKSHCIAIRKGPNRQLLHNFKKVEEHEGDLTSPLLGLSEQDATSVFGEVDAIIHNGADVSLLKTFHSIKRPNVESTKDFGLHQVSKKKTPLSSP